MLWAGNSLNHSASTVETFIFSVAQSELGYASILHISCTNWSSNPFSMSYWLENDGLQNAKPLVPTSGYWAESLPAIDSPLCAVIDPLRDFRWHALRCGGPETAAFLCELS
uniref:C-type lectin domain-containing protein n=1 Tax=Phlebotomus papatasi TaxID=29031 RepID=A0A1B0DLB2_PHLPP